MIIKNKKEWEEFKLNTSKSPKTYPVYGYYENCEFGLMGDANVSFFVDLPKDLTKKEQEIWIKGFKAGRST